MRYSDESFQYIVRAIVDIFVRRRSPMIARIACLDRLMLVATPWSLCAQRYAADFDQEPSDDLVSPGHHGGYLAPESVARRPAHTIPVRRGISGPVRAGSRSEAVTTA